MKLESDYPINILKSPAIAVMISKYSNEWTPESITFANLLEDVELFSKLGMHSKAYSRKKELLNIFLEQQKHIQELEKLHQEVSNDDTK